MWSERATLRRLPRCRVASLALRPGGHEAAASVGEGRAAGEAVAWEAAVARAVSRLLQGASIAAAACRPECHPVGAVHRHMGTPRGAGPRPRVTSDSAAGPSAPGRRDAGASAAGWSPRWPRG